MQSIVLTESEHLAFTKAWRNKIGYSNDAVSVITVNATPSQILDAARIIYKDYPEILKVLGL